MPGIICFLTIPRSFGYGLGCPYGIQEPVVLTDPPYPLLFAATKWCGIAEAPTLLDPATLACRPDFQAAMWQRHERATDNIWLPQARITLRAGPTWVEHQPYFSHYTTFKDPSTAVGNSGDVVIQSTDPFFTGTLEIETVWSNCDLYWNGPLTGFSSNPKGYMAVWVNRLIDDTGAEQALAFAIAGSLTQPFLAVADPWAATAIVPPGNCQLNERSLAAAFGELLGLTPSIAPDNLMNNTGGGANLNMIQCLDARTLLSGNSVIDPPDSPSNRVAFVIDAVNDGAPAPWLDITKVAIVDEAPTAGDLRLAAAVRRPIPDDTNVVAYFLLDSDNNPNTGATINNIVPGVPMTGVDLIGRVVRSGTNVTSAMFRRGPTGNFISIALPSGSLVGMFRKPEHVLINPPQRQEQRRYPAFSEIELRIRNSVLGTSGLDIQAGTNRANGLFPNGLRLQTLVQRQGQTDQFDFAPPTSLMATAGVVRVPAIEFPSLTLPPRARHGEEVTMTVRRMLPNSTIKVIIGLDVVAMGIPTDSNGSATFRVIVPCTLRTGPTLVTVGHLEPRSEATADGVMEIVAGTEAPFITEQPNSQTVIEGSNATFSVSVIGPGPLGYQWHFNGTPIPGATGSSLTLFGASAADMGDYMVVVSSPFGTVNSGAALLLVVPPPVTTLFINEFLANTDPPQLDFVELYNAGGSFIDLSHYSLSDDPSVSRFVVPAGTVIPPGAFLTFAEDQLGFSFSPDGGRIVLKDRNGLTVDTQLYGPQRNGISYGRLPNGAQTFAYLTPTPNAPNVKAPVPTRSFTFPLSLSGQHSVFFHLFSVLAPGTIKAEVTWTGASANLNMALTGRRRPELADPTTPYATANGPSPLTLSYDVTDEGLKRGVAWRLALSDPANLGAASGSITLTIPFDTDLNTRFQREKIALKSGEFWPGPALEEKFWAAHAAAPGGLHALISLRRAVDCLETEQLEDLGLIRQTFLSGGRNSFGLIQRQLNRNHPLLAEVLRSVTPLEPEDKVDPNILLGNYGKFAVNLEDGTLQNYVRNLDGTVKVGVLFAKDVPLERIRVILVAETLSFTPTTDSLWQCTIAPARISALAAYDDVEWIEGGPMPRLPDNSTTRPFVGVDAVQNPTINAMAGTITYNGFSGNGVTVGIEDNGIDATHPDLNVVVNTAALGKHGTHVAGIVAASGAQSTLTDINGNPNGGTAFQWRGMAPNAALIDSQDLITSANLLAAIQNNSLDLINQSQTITTDGNYDGQNQTIDQEIRGGAISGGTRLPRRLRVTSAGNNGTTPQRGNQFDFFAISKQMKNALVVGNWDARPGFNILAFDSSMGPMHDGRIKPDVVAPGDGIRSTGTSPAQTVGCNCYCPNSANGYNFCRGTSMASPCVAGIAALLLEAWQTTYNAPFTLTLDANPPLPSTVRALLIGTAQDIVNNNVRGGNSTEIDADSNPGNGTQPAAIAATAGPDFATGWGQVNAQTAANMLQEFRTESGRRIPNRIIQDSIDQGVILEYDFVVPVAQAFRVTLAWDDVEAALQNPVTTNLLVNDLDLELVAPNGTIFYPWQLGQTILDSMGNPLANNLQPPGTAIRVTIPITAVAPPSLPSGTAGPPEYVPANAMAGAGVWVAGQGKDHLNNVEQVSITAPQAQTGHWKMRVIGFDVNQGPQDYSLVGFPYPALAELVVSSSAKVSFPAFGSALTFNWRVENTGTVGAGAFTYKVFLSRDFYVDPAQDVALTGDVPLGALGSGAAHTPSTAITISQTDADTLLGNAPGSTTVADLVDADVFLLVQVDGPNAVLEHNESNVTFIQVARAVDVVFVMDRSGSMSANIPISAGSRSKMNLLKDSANLFLDLLRRDFGDQLSEVSFAGNVTTDFFPVGGGLTAYTTANRPTAQAAVNALVANGCTDIRLGLQRGLDIMNSGALSGHRKVVIFFSDGMKTCGGNPSDATFLQQFTTQDIKVYSVGFGTRGGDGMSGIDVTLLQQLSNVAGNQGFFHATESSEALDKFFVNAVAGAVQSDVIVDPEADIIGHTTHTVNALIGQQDISATFILTWDNPGFNLDLAVRTPAGLEINFGNAGSFGGQVTTLSRSAYRLMTVRLPLRTSPGTAHQGQWRMLIRNPGNTTLHYSASAITESGIRMQMPPPRSPGGGVFRPYETIPLELTLHGLRGLPVDYARVVVTPNVPLVGLGTLLAGASITPAELAAIPPDVGGDPLGLSQRMYLALLRRFNASNLLPRADGPPIELMQATPGRYGGCYDAHNFVGVQVEGVYTFVARAEGVNTNCDLFQREATISVGVVAQTRPQGTTVDVGWITPTNPTVGVVVTVTPTTPGGHFVGPGSGGTVTINATGNLAPSSEIIDNLDGSYSQTFRTGNPGLTMLAVAVGGVTVSSNVIDTTLPAILSVTPAGGRNNTANSLTVALGPQGNLGAITGIALVSGSSVTSLSGLTVNSNQRTARATVPVGLAPGLYSVLLRGASGLGPASQNINYQVIGEGQNFPVNVGLMNHHFGNIASAGSPAQTLAQFGWLLRDLRALPTGALLSTKAKQDAYNQLCALIALGQGTISEADLAAVSSALNAAKIDARFLPASPAFTPVGRGVRVDLGNGVVVTFGSVLAQGFTSLQWVHGPAEVPDVFRGDPYVAYDITTTALLEPGAPIDVQIEYQETDYQAEPLLRIYHREGSTWVDRTLSFSPDLNLITARSVTLSPYLIVQAVAVQPVLRAVGFDPSDRFTLELSASPGNYSLQRSSDLREWTTVDTLNVGLSPVTFTDPTSGRKDHRFYRIQNP